MGQTVEELVAGLERGERRALARLLTLAEDGAPERLREVVARLHPHTGRARVIGITGSPGVGKSTLTNAIAAALRAQDRSVAILAVDPSSPFSGGALLGDRVRMQSHAADPHVFIRSMASRGHLGGLSFATPQAVLVLDAAGFDDVIVETVGVGQSEVEIAATADTTVVALAPGMGDGIQAAKAGILEVADVFVINKADASGAGKLESELRGMLEMGHALADADTPAGWWPPIVRTVAVRGEGLDDVLDAFGTHDAWLASSGRGEQRRRERALHLVREIALEQVRLRFARLDGGDDPLLEELADRVATRQRDPYAAADDLLEALDGGEA
ncbi:methylmalonyl Co-A mutase-associated GTPase MeaB [Egicoccus halophilus]|uniref:Transporter n=1 Tax=Egicoccus halophilus TaxID=1670830 RepID=A0A8J3AD02_9ACTN|nr:methylmalonyl Co-A mutase-associated GTPase MeaB [Egicoccus halophilus]GGI04207.1 transporter [Egicoccus halophilus]